MLNKEREVLEFPNTYMTEPEEEMFFDTSEKILRLSDVLAENIILENIGEQLTSKLDALSTKINYVSLFREKYGEIEPSDAYYDGEYLKESLARVAALLSTGIKERYGIELGEDLEFTTPAQYLEDTETLYEFLFIRHYENLMDFFKHRLRRDKLNFINSYKNRMNEDKHSKDLFVIQSKKKFKNSEDVIIMHFLEEIISDIRSTTQSAYDLFREIVDLDLYEEYNHKMSELLINYGNKIVINDDYNSAKLYLEPLDDSSVFSELRNNLLISYLEECELEK